MAATTLDFATMGMCWVLIGALFLVISLVMRKPRHNPGRGTFKTVYIVFVVFIFALFANTVFLSIPNTSRVGLVTSERFGDIPAPDMYVSYPTSARAGETVEIVVGAVNVNLPTDIEMSIENARTSETLGEAFMAIEEGEEDARTFTQTMPERDLKIVVKAIHQDTLSELRTTVTIERAGLDVAFVLLMGVVVASPILTVTNRKR